MGWRFLLMNNYYPNLLTRQQAMQMLNCNRNKLEKLTKNNPIRKFKTSGNHNRYFRDDLIKYNSNLTNQNNG
jgi:hypothetical protein